MCLWGKSFGFMGPMLSLGKPQDKAKNTQHFIITQQINLIFMYLVTLTDYIVQFSVFLAEKMCKISENIDNNPTLSDPRGGGQN